MGTAENFRVDESVENIYDKEKQDSLDRNRLKEEMYVKHCKSGDCCKLNSCFCHVKCFAYVYSDIYISISIGKRAWLFVHAIFIPLEIAPPCF